MAGFVVCAGKYEAMDGDVEKNYKVITGEMAIEDALREMATCNGYAFIDLEYHAADGKIFLVNLEPINLG